MKRFGRWIVMIGAALALPPVAWLCLPKPPPSPPLSASRQVLDRDGRLLQLTLTPDEKYRIATPLDAISPELVGATLLQEDQHFWSHPGINPVASVRALGHLCIGQPGWGGASTITMQLARLRYRLHTRSPLGKLVQMWRALEIERHSTKAQILEEYLNTAPYGGNIEGIGAASLIYFAMPPARLTRGESLLLAVLPQSPTRRGLRTEAAQRAIVDAAKRLAARLPAGTDQQLAVLPPPRRTGALIAPHFVRQTLVHPSSSLRTTLDRNLQQLVSRRITSYLEANQQSGLENAAALLVDSRSMEVLAQIGSADFFSEAISGQIDGTRSRRSPGSTLKPFIYALAMDQGLIHPLTMLADAPRRFGAYSPENFDGDFAGPIKACDALVRSRNVPAVALAEKLARPDLYEFLKRGGVALPHDEGFYGLSLVLGGGEVTMEELVRLYTALANGGRLRALRRTLGEGALEPGLRIVSPEAAFLALEMLSHSPRPDLNAEDEGVCWKTGTSMGFRDAWSVAVFDHYVLAVWVGNFDGRRNPALVGRTCAAPLLFRIIDAMRSEGRARTRPLHPPPGANLRQVEFCAITGQLPTAACTHRCQGWFIPGISPITACEVHREIFVDTHTGLRLPGDDGSTEVRKEVYEFWPSDLMTLFARAGLPRRRPPPFAPGAGVDSIERTGRPPEIVSPASGRVYAVRPGDPSTAGIVLQARSEADVARIYWFQGKTFLGSAGPRESLTWQPLPGLHRIVALDDHGRSSNSTVTMQSTEMQ